MIRNIGVSSYCCSSLLLDEALDRLAPQFACIEILDGGLHALDNNNVEILESYDNKYSIHAPVSDVNIGSIFEPTRRASIDILESRFQIAAVMDASIVIHPGHVSWESDRPLAHRQLTKSIQDLLHLQEEYGVRFYIENLLNWESSLIRTPDDLHLIEGAALALDIGHAHTCGCLTDFLELPCEYYHLHDNDGINDQHISLGAGTINMSAVVKALKRDRDATMIFETNLHQDALTSKDYLLGVMA